MNGQKLRISERGNRRALWWERRRREAVTPAEQARCAWDQIVSDIAHLPVEEQDSIWVRVAQALDGVGVNLTTRQASRRGAQRTAATPARTRGGEPNTSRKEGGR